MKQRDGKRGGAKPVQAAPQPSSLHAPGPSPLDLQRTIGNRATQEAIAGQAPTRSLTPAPAPPAPDAVSAAAPAPAPRETAVPPAMAWIVEDRAPSVAPGQMRKSEFLAQLKQEVCGTSDEGLAPAGLTSDGCPWIAHWFAVYEGKNVAHVERAVRLYAPETAAARSAADYVRLVATQVRRSIDRWVLTGEVSGVPSGMPGEPTPSEGIFPKARDGVARPGADPQAIQAQLGAGRPLDATVRSRMESGLGVRLAGVRLHTDPQSARLSRNLGASAFTVGEHVAFAQGEYRPGTPVGDALIAHELAHVVQQGPGGAASAGPMAKDSGPSNALEEEADRSAVGAVTSLWRGARQWMGDPGGDAFPRLRSGLQLQRCGTTKKAAAKDALEKVKKESPEAKAVAEEAEEAKCPAGDETKKVDALAKSMIGAYKLAAVDADSNSCWTLAELRKVEKAIQKIPAEQLPALDGVTLRRVATANCAGHSADGCFIESAEAATGKRQDRLELGDGAFAKDKDFDAGGAHIVDSEGKKIDLIPSQRTTIHEIGHAVESVERRAAEAERLVADLDVKKVQEAYKAAYEAFDPAMPQGGTSPGWSNSKEKAYDSAISDWNKRLLDVYGPTKAIGDNPSAATLDEQAKSMKVIVAKAAKAEAALKKASDALPASSTVRDTARESDLKAAQQAAGKLVSALEKRRDAQRVLEGAQAKEAKTQEAIKMGAGAAPTSMTRRLAEFVAIIHIRKIDVATHEPMPEYGRENWPDRPGELFADLYEWSVTDPPSVGHFHPDIAAFFRPPIGVKDKKLRTEVDKWIKGRR